MILSFFFDRIIAKIRGDIMILIVEDDKDLNDTLYDFLSEKFEVLRAFDGEEALKLAYEKNIDLIILDIKLPKLDGFEVAKEIRKFKQTPIIFLTSLDSQKDVEKGFLSGGDDYIKKPFSLKELYFRIEAILKRVYKEEKMQINDFVFDMKNLELFKGDEKIHLKTKELKLLSLFLKNKNRILTKDEIFNEIYEYDENPNENSLRTFIRDLRHILGNEVIETIKGVGYKFVI
jgi:DNA-binding response OmpR family regulator